MGAVYPLLQGYSVETAAAYSVRRVGWTFTLWAVANRNGNFGRLPRTLLFILKLLNINAKNGGGIMPLGGSNEVLGSHKGYGYGMMCEIFASILSMGATSNYCMQNGKGNICHGFMAINPAFFGDPDAIRAHFSKFLQELREAPKAEGQTRIYTHGEKEVEAIADRRANGIPVNDNTMVEVLELCEYLNMDFSKYFGDYLPPKKGENVKASY